MYVGERCVRSLLITTEHNDTEVVMDYQKAAEALTLNDAAFLLRMTDAAKRTIVTTMLVHGYTVKHHCTGNPWHSQVVGIDGGIFEGDVDRMGDTWFMLTVQSYEGLGKYLDLSEGDYKVRDKYRIHFWMDRDGDCFWRGWYCNDEIHLGRMDEAIEKLLSIYEWYFADTTYDEDKPFTPTHVRTIMMDGKPLHYFHMPMIGKLPDIFGHCDTNYEVRDVLKRQAIYGMDDVDDTESQAVIVNFRSHRDGCKFIGRLNEFVSMRRLLERCM